MGKSNRSSGNYCIENVSDIVFMLNDHGVITYASSNCYDILGYEPEELVGQIINKYIDQNMPSWNGRNYCNMGDLYLKGQRNIEDEFRIVHKDGSWRWHHLKGNLTKSDNEIVLTAVSRDISDRKQMGNLLAISENRFRELFNGISSGVIICNVVAAGDEFIVVDLNQAAEKIELVQKEQVINRSLAVAFPSSVEFGLLAMAKHVWITEEPQRYPLVLYDEDELVSWKEYYMYKLTSGEMVFVFDDITSQKLAETKLRQHARYNKLIADISADFVNVTIINLDDKINRMLASLGEFFTVDRSYLFQISKDRKMIHNTNEWCNEGINSQTTWMKEISLEELPWFTEQIFIKDHLIIQESSHLQEIARLETDKVCHNPIVTQSVLAVPIKNDNNGLVGFFGFDVVTKKKDWTEDQITLLKVIANLLGDALIKYDKDAEIHFLSFHDKLTGLYNRAFFDAEMQRLDTERQIPISLIMADVNGLKLVNDAFGHKHGDYLLQKVADVFLQCFRKEDIICRWGGDEFAVLVPQADEDIAMRSVEDLKTRFAKEKPNPLYISVALGYATKKDMHVNINDVLREAEANMYNDKLAEARIYRRKIFSYLTERLALVSKEEDYHIWRVQVLAIKLGERMGLSEKEMDELIAAVAMHDLGKVTLPELILTQKRPLKGQELETYKKHVECSYHITIGFKEYSHVAPIVLAHHENWDGSGYPQGLVGNDIPMIARLIRIVDWYDRHHNDNRDIRLSHSEAIELIQQEAGKKFDSAIVREFVCLDFDT